MTQVVDAAAAVRDASGATRFFAGIERLTTTEMALCNRLVAVRGHRLRACGLVDGRSTGEEHCVRILLDVEGIALVLQLASHHAARGDRWFGVGQDAPELMAALWSLRLARLLHGVQRLWGVRMVLREVAPATSVPDLLGVQLEYGGVRLRGWLDAERWLRVVPVKRAKRVTGSRRLIALPSTLRVTAVPVRVDPVALAGLARGDLLLLETDWQGTLAAIGHPLDGNKLYSLGITGDGTMTINDVRGGLDAAAGDDTLSVSRVEVTVELARHPLTLGELEALDVGHILRLPRGLDDLDVRLSVRGRCIAEGTLLDIAGVLGVRITTLHGAADAA